MKTCYRGWLPTDLDAFFNFSFLFCLLRSNQFFKTKNGVTIPANQKASKRKGRRSHHLFLETD